jgi:hypothetical protein
MKIDSDFRLTIDGLVIRPASYDEVAGLNHPLYRVRPPAVDLVRFSYFVAVRAHDGAIVTSLGIEQVRDYPGTISMDWATARSEQRKGFASRSARALIEWLCRQPDIRCIEIDIVPGNEAKDRTADRIGFVRTAKRGRWEWRPMDQPSSSVGQPLGRRGLSPAAGFDGQPPNTA